MADENKKTLEVELFWSPVSDKEGFKGEAKVVSSENKIGKFDILPQHTNFITRVFNSITIQTPEEEISYEFNRGVLEVSENKVRVFLEL